MSEPTAIAIALAATYTALRGVAWLAALIREAEADREAEWKRRGYCDGEGSARRHRRQVVKGDGDGDEVYSLD